MDLRHLTSFLAVAEELNFGRAAEKLHISQPPLSRQIQEFEEEIGAPLFDRHGKKTSLTEAGVYLLIEAERLLGGIEAACRTAKAIADKSRALKVGCVTFFLNSQLAPFLEVVRQRHPDLKLDILVMSTKAQENALISGALDLGFVRSGLNASEALVFEPVAEEALVLVFPARVKLEGEPAACVAALADEPFIAMSRSSASGLVDRIAEVCAGYGVSPQSAFECNDAFSIVGLVASGLGWSIIPELELRDAEASGIGLLRLPQKTVIGLSYRPEGLSPEAQEFVGLARRHFGNLAST
jgi:DNA-binding transcriptional LysR family regulator